MLVLSRKEGDSIFIGEDIKITILTSFRNQVRVGIKAPKEIKIVREELLERNKLIKELEKECDK